MMNNSSSVIKIVEVPPPDRTTAAAASGGGGPRTEEGKARSSQNALRTGWFARSLRLHPDQEPVFGEFEAAWLAELAPGGLREMEVFHDFLRAAWHKREIIEAQNTLAESSPGTFLDEENRKAVDRLHRYERDFERRASRALSELRRLQSDRAARRRLPAETAAEAPPLATAESLAQKRTPPAPVNLPEDVLATLHVMEIETSHWNARVRAQKAGLPVN